MFRYAGGKAKLYKKIEPFIEDGFDGSLVIPFIGAGHETIAFLQKETPNFLWLNDIDPGIAAIWKSVYFYPLKFIHKINKYSPSVSDFYDFKEELKNDINPKGLEEVTDVALMKLVIHQISYSGLGVMAGGPIGGQNQSSKYSVDCRWNKNRLSKKIWEVNQLIKKSEVRITSWDFQGVLEDKQSNCFMYLDPPYLEKGNELYMYGFTMEDHWRLSELLHSRDKWVLSYDDSPIVRSFYRWADICEIEAGYSIRTARKKTELVILPPIH